MVVHLNNLFVVGLGIPQLTKLFRKVILGKVHKSVIHLQVVLDLVVGAQDVFSKPLQKEARVSHTASIFVLFVDLTEPEVVI